VSAPKPTREQLIALAKRDPKAIADLALSLWNRVEALAAKVAELQRNSRTSSKPPSSDKGNFANPPKPKSLRRKSGKKSGGQPGHLGSTRTQSATPDHIEEHRLDRAAVCLKCGGPLEIAPSGIPLHPQNCECRQVFELPAIRIEITEHRAEKTFCQRCGAAATAAFPEGVAAPVQYGPTVRAVALYLGGYQMIPYQRLAETFRELFACPLNQGTLANIVHRPRRRNRLPGHGKAPLAARILHRIANMFSSRRQTGCRSHGARRDDSRLPRQPDP
jgi:transposase